MRRETTPDMGEPGYDDRRRDEEAFPIDDGASAMRGEGSMRARESEVGPWRQAGRRSAPRITIQVGLSGPEPSSWLGQARLRGSLASSPVGDSGARQAR